MEREDQWTDRMVSRFQAASVARRAPAALPDAWRARCAALVEAPGVAPLVVGAVRAGELEQRIAAGVAAAHAQAGDDGARLVTEGIAGLGALLGTPKLLHGTGSWGLAGILRDGEVRAGGDGLTGEVAITDVDDPAIYVCRPLSIFNLYSAACFGLMNANSSGEELRISSVRDGLPWLADFFTQLLFGEGAPVIEASPPVALVRIVRYRTRETDELLREAYDRAIALARARAFPPQRQALARVVGVASPEAALTNALFAILWRERREDPAFQPAGDALCAAVLRHAPALRARLLCPLPEDDAAARARKDRTLAALREQFPCVLVIDEAGVDVQMPSYFWTGECLVPGAIDARRIVAVYAPLARRDEVRASLDAAGLGRAEVRPLEHYEALRLVAEVKPR